MFWTSQYGTWFSSRGAKTLWRRDDMRPTIRNLLSDLVREQVLINTREEVYSVAVKIKR